ncbi:alpha/beta hydrolase [Lutimonas saemankumensis]|uniref:alpha/beta fold hydrolase n=1 Tax=Lutimonas saemankumensis TaxID=483016 RepID=UPI001CD6D7EB|nr:alpha/beta hydrolase [Lutimonas saemankumensis]MCA0931415.1 alpha/beta hydrolase [Lutimonas saemankumensis]
MKKIFILILTVSFLICCEKNKPERFVEINGAQLHIKEFGEGKPTVLFENGMGSSMDTWKSIPDSISKDTRVFSYDRSGTGKSELTPSEKKIPFMVDELRALLSKENINPPYIYVAHSMGSYLARYFAIHYPDELQALVLVDPSPDKLYDGYSQEEYNEFKEIGNQSFANSSVGERKEWENYLDNRKYVQNAPVSDDITMVIVSATQWDFYDFHSQIMNNNKNSRHLKIDGGHDIHQERPERIIEIIRDLLDQSRN